MATYLGNVKQGPWWLKSEAEAYVRKNIPAEHRREFKITKRAYYTIDRKPKG